MFYILGGEVAVEYSQELLEEKKKEFINRIIDIAKTVGMSEEDMHNEIWDIITEPCKSCYCHQFTRNMLL